MDHPAPEWHVFDDYHDLRYRGVPIARIYLQDGGIEVNTRCYSQGFTRTHRLGTLEGARLFVDAWFRKWGAQAMREVDNKHHAAEVEAAYRASLPPVEIKPDPRKRRRGRKAW